MTKTICPICQQELDRVLRPDFLLCPDCQVAVRVSGTLAKEPDRMNAYNDRWVERHAGNPTAKDIAKHMAQIVSSVLNEHWTAKVIDIGCGSGVLVDRLSRIGYLAYGLDWSEPAIRFAREHYQGKYILANVENTLKVERLWNCVVASHILEHLENPHEFLESVKEVLEPNGYLVVAVPNLDWWIPKHPYRSVSSLFDAQHAVGYSPNGLVKLLRMDGYKPELVITKTHRTVILDAIGATVYRKVFGGKGNSAVKSGYVKVTGDGVLASVLSRGMTPWNRWSERGAKGMELIVVARKDR